MTVEAFCKEGSDTTVRMLAEDVQKIVETEAPVSLDVVVKRLCEACDIAKVTPKIMARALYIVRYARVCCPDLTAEDGKKFIYRSPSDIGDVKDTYRTGGDRDIADVAVEELASAAISITLEQYGMPQEDLIKEVASAFGCKRAAVTSNAFKTASAGVEFALANNYLMKDDRGWVVRVP